MQTQFTGGWNGEEGYRGLIYYGKTDTIDLTGGGSYVNYQIPYEM